MFSYEKEKRAFLGSFWWLLVAYLTLHSLKIVADLSDIIDILPVLVPERMVVRPRVLLDLPLQD